MVKEGLGAQGRLHLTLLTGSQLVMMPWTSDAEREAAWEPRNWCDRGQQHGGQEVTERWRANLLPWVSVRELCEQTSRDWEKKEVVWVPPIHSFHMTFREEELAKKKKKRGFRTWVSCVLRSQCTQIQNRG